MKANATQDKLNRHFSVGIYGALKSGANVVCVTCNDYGCLEVIVWVIFNGQNGCQVLACANAIRSLASYNCVIYVLKPSPLSKNVFNFIFMPQLFMLKYVMFVDIICGHN